jgi:hypothetical protein
MSAQFLGVLLVGVGVAIALFGDKEVDAKGGRISKLFSMPASNVKAAKWGVAVSLIGLGVVLMVGADRL